MKTDANGYQQSLDQLLLRVRACRVCADHLPLGPRPIVRASETARLLIVGQAPGTRVHATGIPWNDASGNRLRQWLALSPEHFYDESRVAIIPMGLCYPGRYPDRGGDLPPRPECAPLWHARLREHLPAVRLTLLVGRYAQSHYLQKAARRACRKPLPAGGIFYGRGCSLYRTQAGGRCDGRGTIRGLMMSCLPPCG